MVKLISKGLKWTFFINFIVYVVFGVVLFFLMEDYLEWIGIPYFMPVFSSPFYFGPLFGGALLAFASVFFFAWRQKEWENVKIVMLMNIVWNMLGAFVFIYARFYSSSLHPMTFIHTILFFGFLAAFIIFYIQHEKEKIASK